MSAADMLVMENRATEAGQFFGWLEDRGVNNHRLGLEQLTRTAVEPIWGPVFASNLEYFRDPVNDIDPTAGAHASDVLNTVFSRSAEEYSRDKARVRPIDTYSVTDLSMAEEFEVALRGVQAQMTEGKIELLPPQFAMTVDEGRKQVELANGILSWGASPRVRRLLSDTNYSLFFSRMTMADGAAILEGSIDEAVESDTQAQMPHLTRTNYAIGQFVASLAENARGRMTIVDAGAGTGATLTAMISALNEVHAYDRTAIYGVESNRDFYASLKSLAPTLTAKIQDINPDFQNITNASKIYPGQEDLIGIINKDITHVIEDIERGADQSQDVTVLTANYVWHRIPMKLKRRMIDVVSGRLTNRIFIIADLARNSSEVNRRYFNFGNNGPLNCGNIGLRDQFEKQGYVVKKVSRSWMPDSINPKLSEKICMEADNDGHMWVAASGGEALRLVEAAS